MDDKKQQFGKLFIYLVRLDGKPCYVGQVHGKKQTVNGRWEQHCHDVRHGRKLWCAVQAFGREHFTVEVIDEATDRNDLNQKEKFHIKQFGTYYGFGFNGNTGGLDILARRKPGFRHPEEVKRKISESNTGQERSAETCEKIRATSIGRKLSDEAKRKVGLASAARERKPMSEETKKVLSEKLTGRHHTEEAKAKIGAASKGNKHNLGAKRGPRSPEVKEKIRIALLGRKHSAERRENQAAAALKRFSTEEGKAAWYESRWGTN
jgi:group I intron endonuclease